jgi:hypothetical protein
VNTGLNGMSDALADIITHTKSAKEAFRDMAKALVEEIAKIVAKLLVQLAVQIAIDIATGGAAVAGRGVSDTVKGFGFADGGVMPGRMIDRKRFASGGVTNRPTLALFGEGRGAEAFVPLPDGRTIPVTMKGIGGGGGGELHLHVHAIDSRDAASFLAEHADVLHSLLVDGLGHEPSLQAAVKRAAR